LPADPQRLVRFLRPRSVAIVGASERQARSNNAVEAMRQAGVELHFVNPRRDEVYGERAFATVADLGRPVDAVLSLVNAERAVDAVADARRADAGGVVVIAGGFAESGPDGVDLQRRLAAAAGPIPVLGPNCNGFIRTDTGARLSGAPLLPFPRGSIGLVTHSGALLGALGLGAAERTIGFSSLISTGNEMALDMADCLEFLVDDEVTAAIGLVVETIRSPERFFAAARRARSAGKPIVALKLGRSPRGQEITTSHTGAMAGQPWVYDAVFRQHGIASATDLVDLLDRLWLFDQLPREQWCSVDGLAILSLSGGWCALASDVAAQEDLPLPALTDLLEAINGVVPERTTANPLDMTGFAMGKAAVVEDLLDIYAASPEVDALLLQWFVDASAEQPGRAMIDAAVAAAGRTAKPVLIGSIEDGHPGEWARALPAHGVAVGRGLRSTVRGLATMRDFIGHHPDAGREAPVTRPLPFPAAEVINSSAGPMLSFVSAMELLQAHGISVAPFAILEAGADPAPALAAFAPPLVVKLADVPHRTELGAVRARLDRQAAASAITDLCAIAARDGLPERIVVQPQVAFSGEAFVGADRSSGLGPLVMCGVGGILVEFLGAVGAALAPIDETEADRLLDALVPTGVFDGVRGAAPWGRRQLAQLLVRVGQLVAGSEPWLVSLDINPLAVTDAGFHALDCLCLVKRSEAGNSP
jgi:acyl-CoA synthetase (NDP forming)